VSEQALWKKSDACFGPDPRNYMRYFISLEDQPPTSDRWWAVLRAHQIWPSCLIAQRRYRR